MGFFYADAPQAPKAARKSGGSKKVLIPKQVSGCAHCTLNTAQLIHPKMEPTGAKRPQVYILGEAPGKNEDEQGEQFIGDSGQILRGALPEGYERLTRWNNTIRCHPPGNREPSRLETQCCRKSIEEDIEATKPKLILLMGAVPLEWLNKETRVIAWRGRLMPVRIGSHECYAMSCLHPSYILRNRNSKKGRELVAVFEKDLARAYQMLEAGEFDEAPWVPRPEEHFEGVECLLKPDLMKLKAWLDEALTWEELSLDLETNRLRPYAKDSRILSLSISCFDKTYAIPYKHSQTPWPKKDLITVKKLLKDFLYQSHRKWAHNLNFELEWLIQEFGEALAFDSPWGDTMAQAYILDEREGAKGLDDLVKQYMGFGLKEISGVDTKRLDHEPVEVVLKYNALDAKYTLPLMVFQHQRLEAEGLSRVYDEQVKRSAAIVIAQSRGVMPNIEAAEELKGQYEAQITEIMRGIFADADIKAFQRKKPDFSVTSNTDLLAFFRDHLKRREVNVGKKNEPKYSTDESVLTQIDHPVAASVLELRKASKMLSTYVMPYINGGKHIHDDGLIHAQFNHNLTATGRLSCEDPNLQNFPKRKGKELRIILKAPDGYWIVSIDYGQIEARIIGVASQDKVLVDALWDDYDIHLEWAERLAHAYPDRVGGRKFLKDKGAIKKFRSDVKNQWTFPLFYGSILESVAGNLEMPVEVVKPLYDEFWQMFSGVHKWQNRVLKDYKRTGYVETLTGRRRHEPMSANEIINSGIQGTASDVVTDASVRLARIAHERDNPELHFRINVHDDLTFYFSDEHLEANIETAAKEMLLVPFDFINVPLTVEVSVGKTWDSQEEVEVFRSTDYGVTRALAH